MRYQSYREIYIGEEHSYIFTTVPCPGCGETEKISVYGEDLFRYNQGHHIQKAFPYLSDAQRERLITGTCGKCWDEMWKDEDE